MTPPADILTQLRAAVRAAMATGIRQTAMAEAIGWRQGNLSAFLAGRRGISIAQADRLAAAAGATITVEPINARRSAKNHATP